MPILRPAYAPDAVKNEFVNLGLVLMPPAGSAQVRFTRDGHACSALILKPT